MKKLYRGIEPIIAVVILVAITLVIAIGVIGWIMGWWGTFGATESIKIYPDSYIDSTPNRTQLVLHLKNEGSATAVIYKIEVTGLGSAIPRTTTGVTPEKGIIVTNNEVTISPGAEGTIVIDLEGSAIAGTRYHVTLYTRAGNVISATVQAR
ncbi:MAG: archaellin/type IV pilin N-terminal domain-containing protein [Ignisphaera sp.]